MKIPTLLITLFFPLAAMAKLPDVILMMSDDRGWEETGYNGHPHVKTPVLDEMAANGLKFDRFYAYPHRRQNARFGCKRAFFGSSDW